jgi:hypothetical protein
MRSNPERTGVAVTLLHQLVIGRDVMCLALAEHRADAKAFRVAAEVDFGGEPATRAAKCLVLRPPFLPAAQPCARTVAFRFFGGRLWRSCVVTMEVVLLQALADSGGDADALQMIDST